MTVEPGWSSVRSVVGGRCWCAVALVVAALVVVPNGLAAGWLPHAADATWTYKWTDSVYAPTPTTENVTVKDTKGGTFTLAWTTVGLNNPADAVSTTGQVAFQETNAGLVNTDWTSNAPPPSWPVLCATPAGCPNALSSAYYNVIWGSRSPVLAEPLLQGTTWPSTGGAQNDVSAASTYLGTGADHRSGVPGAGDRGEGALDDHPGRCARRSVRQRHAHDLVGVRRRPGEDRVPARGRERRAGDLGDAPEHEPDAAGATVGHRLLPAQEGPVADVPLDEHEASDEAGGAALHDRRRRERHGTLHREERLRPDQGCRDVRVLEAARRRHEPLGHDAVGDAADVPAARAAECSDRRSQSHTHAVRPDDVRLQSDPPGIRRQGATWSADTAESRLLRSTASPGRRR